MTTIQDYDYEPLRVNPCTDCYREATETLIREGCEVRLCPSCACWATLNDPVSRACEDCTTSDATRQLHTPDGRTVHLCEPCWMGAEHTACHDLCECHDSPCEDCGVEPATRLFIHLDSRGFHLCDRCWVLADHTDDYLLFCACEVPHQGHGEIIPHCRHCHLEIRRWAEDDEGSVADSDDGESVEDADEEEWALPSLVC
jgi:hypothetical protein